MNLNCNNYSRTCLLGTATLVLGMSALTLTPATAMAATDADANRPAAVAQQQKVVKGHVVDEFGEPMIGVTVKVDGTVGGGNF